MTREMKDAMAAAVRDFRLPRYGEIPNVGLYLEQVTKYVCDCLAPLGDVTITGSMISNYVKRGLVDNPVKKQYGRGQIACLIYIAVAKNVLSLDDIDLLMRMQRRTYELQVAYDYFCAEFENLLFYVFGLKSAPDTVGTEATDEKLMLRNTIITVAHKIYLDMCFRALDGGEAPLP